MGVRVTCRTRGAGGYYIFYLVYEWELEMIFLKLPETSLG